MTLRLGDTLIAGSGANTDLSNLSSQGKNIAKWSNNVTNCITEIPQDIKLELNNGTLTLKAGSKVYVPNGSGVFVEKTISQDYDLTLLMLASNQFMLFVVYDSNVDSFVQFNRQLLSKVSSGTTAPTNGVFFDITNNVINTYSSGVVGTDKFSLPIGLITTNSSGAISSIDQVFNGFGYIGSTVFALPGVKGLIPNGRNADGTLKNTEFTIDTVKTFNNTIIRNNSNLTINQNANIYPQNVLSYDNEKNLNISINNSVVMVCKYAIWNADSTGKITSFASKTAFHALDYNDLKSLPNYNPTTTQTLKHVNGVLQWG